jgi:hypothetical protein
VVRVATPHFRQPVVSDMTDFSKLFDIGLKTASMGFESGVSNSNNSMTLHLLDQFRQLVTICQNVGPPLPAIRSFGIPVFQIG